MADEQENKRFFTYLEPDQALWVEEGSKKMRISETAFIRYALSRFMELENDNG